MADKDDTNIIEIHIGPAGGTFGKLVKIERAPMGMDNRNSHLLKDPTKQHGTILKHLYKNREFYVNSIDDEEFYSIPLVLNGKVTKFTIKFYPRDYQGNPLSTFLNQSGQQKIQELNQLLTVERNQRAHAARLISTLNHENKMQKQQLAQFQFLDKVGNIIRPPFNPDLSLAKMLRRK